MARVNGRTVVATDQKEQEVLLKLGLSQLRVPRKMNPYQVARRLARAAKPHPDVEFLRTLIPQSGVSPEPPGRRPLPQNNL